MKLAVIGAGAMGGSLAAHAARAGHDVTVIDAAPALVEHIKTSGITVHSPEGTFTETVNASLSAADSGPCDLVVLFVKAGATAAAAGSAVPLIGRSSVFLTLQNGWGNADVVRRCLDGILAPERLVVGVTYNSCTLLAPGQVKHSARGATTVGPFLDGGSMDAARTAASIVDSAGWAAAADIDVKRVIWQKLVLNAATLAPAALTRLPAGPLGDFSEMADLVAGLARESCAVAQGLGFDISTSERLETISSVLRGAGSGKPSMLQDIEARRKTEIETVNGAVVAAASGLGLDVPLNRAVVSLIHGLERSYLP